MDIADVLDKVTPAERVVTVCVNGSISGRLEALQQRWLEALNWDQNHNEPATATAVADQIEALRADATAATIEFRLRAIGSTAWRRLVAEYPPPEDDADGWRWNVELFPSAAVAACCVDPAMTEAQAQELADRLSDAQFSRLFGAVLTVNVSDDSPKFGPGTDVPPISGPNSTIASLEESLTLSS